MIIVDDLFSTCEVKPIYSHSDHSASPLSLCLSLSLSLSLYLASSLLPADVANSLIAAGAGIISSSSRPSRIASTLRAPARS